MRLELMGIDHLLGHTAVDYKVLTRDETCARSAQIINEARHILGNT